LGEFLVARHPHLAWVFVADVSANEVMLFSQGNKVDLHYVIKYHRGTGDATFGRIPMKMKMTLY
ncbi:MAG: hypothetical protein ACRC5C_07335, partial [Bacilli bacterium]